MDSPKHAITIVVLALVPFVFIYQSDGASYPSGSHGDSAEIALASSQKVHVSVYYDSLSLPCATFNVKNLQDIFYKDLINIVNLHLVPWASAHVIKTNNSIICQKGPDECMLNTLEACAINIWNVDKSYALINCFEFLAIEGRHQNWKGCFIELGLPIQPILNCYNSGNATELAQKYINEIALLDPPPTILPWVVVNNQPIREEYENLISYVCKAYRGTAAPAACNVR